jgi:hypothetical protein
MKWFSGGLRREVQPGCTQSTWGEKTSEGGKEEGKKEKQEKNLTLPPILNTGSLKCFPHLVTRTYFHHLFSPYSCSLLLVSIPLLCSSNHGFAFNTLPNARAM